MLALRSACRSVGQLSPGSDTHCKNIFSLSHGVSIDSVNESRWGPRPYNRPVIDLPYRCSVRPTARYIGISDPSVVSIQLRLAIAAKRTTTRLSGNRNVVTAKPPSLLGSRASFPNHTAGFAGARPRFSVANSLRDLDASNQHLLITESTEGTEPYIRSKARAAPAHGANGPTEPGGKRKELGTVGFPA